MSEKNSVIMEVKNINLRFGGVIAIQDVSFNIFEGEIRAIIGPNGAGKSSMLNVINGFYHHRRVRFGLMEKKGLPWNHTKLQRLALLEHFRTSRCLKV